MRREDAHDRLLGAIDELTKPRAIANRDAYWDSSRNRKFRVTVTQHPPLLVELACAVVPGNGPHSDAGVRTVPGSRPPAHLDAIDRLEAIREGAALWCGRIDVAVRAYLADTLRGLLGAVGRMPDDILEWLAIDASQWVTWARVVTGWATPPYAPHVPCPACEAVGSLRIHLERKAGCCLRCGAAWREDDGGIYMLGEIVRQFTTAEEESA